MSKAIVFCADGTWNGPDKHSDGAPGRTNVYKLYANLAGSPEADPRAEEQERTVVNAGGKQVQIAKYLHGVGNSDNALVKLLGGSVGAGLIERVVRGYTFISRNYLAGDRIYITGFSRGAYTARALAGLISQRGLLDATSLDLDDKDHAYRLGLSVWYDYRKQYNRGGGFLGVVRGFLDDVMSTCLDHATTNLISHVPIEAVAVWDTVGALGIPLYDHGGVLDFFKFADMRLPPAVRTGIHAVAADEERITFTPSLWDPDPRVTQVLFAGAHGDIGGGYPDPDAAVDDYTPISAGLSDIAYQWIAGRLEALGVLFAEKPCYEAKGDPLSIAHRPWLRDPWPGLGVGPRTFPADIRISRKLIDRLKKEVPLEGDNKKWAYDPQNGNCFNPKVAFPDHQIEP